MALGIDDVKAALADLEDPYLGSPLAEQVAAVDEGANSLSVAVDLGYPAAGRRDEICSSIAGELKSRLGSALGDRSLTVDLDWDIQPNRSSKIPQVPGVKNLVAVASGKGGVGKSTVAVNLALALKAEGARVGLLDGDIYGPSQGVMLGAKDMRPTVLSESSMMPVTVHGGLQCMSLSFVLGDRTPAVWRGPMASGAFNQLMTQTQWDALDYLVVDMPPGTGDIQLTLAQNAAISGAVIVTTPQDIALVDAKRGIEMFKGVEVPILGVVENMSMHVCADCGRVEHLFGEGGGRNIAEEYEIRLLAEIPLQAQIRDQCDGGVPPLLAEPDGDVAGFFRETARRVGADLHELSKKSDVIPIVQVYDPD